LISHSLQGR